MSRLATAPRFDEATFRAMACEVSVQVGAAERVNATQAMRRVEAIFGMVERQCTRFDPSSALMLANAECDSWVQVPELCLTAIAEAALAHELTDGRFDPRIYDVLRRLGYDHTLPFAGDAVHIDAPDEPVQATVDVDRWRPGLDVAAGQVRIGRRPIDLGGIGKGLAVRWSAEELRDDVRCFAISAGGDCYLAGAGPDGTGWRVGIENPAGGDASVAVLALTDVACATSSIRVRHWTVGGRAVHHLIDPRTGEPGGAGLASVTVVDKDAARAEVWSKVLFLDGAAGIAAEAEERGLAAFCVTEDGRTAHSSGMQRHMLWQVAT
jgi:thiamine biosynthesis lipoprotein